MEQQRIIFESSPAFIIFCIAAGVGYAILLYKTSSPWPVVINRILFAFRAILVFFLALLLLGPIVRQINNLFEKPLYVILNDNSVSVRETTDSVKLKEIQAELATLTNALTEQGYEVRTTDLDGNEGDVSSYNKQSSDIQGALRHVSDLFEGRNLAGVVLVSDGIFNSGISPLYANYNFPVHTIGVGDTSQRKDLSIRNVAYNKIAYQGNQFPVRVEVMARGFERRNVTVTISHKGNVLDKKVLSSGAGSPVTFDFQVTAHENGIQKIDIQIQPEPEEFNTRNNKASVFIEVVEGKKKILMVANAPHPDIKALRYVITKNENYEFFLHIPGVAEQPASVLRPEQTDLAIFYQAPDTRGKTRELFQQFAKSKTSLFLLVGQQSDLVTIARQNMPLKFEAMPRDFDEVTPTLNTGFSSFTLSTEAYSEIVNYPPVSVHFGRIQIPLSATPVLFQRVGNVSTDKPMLAVDAREARKVAIMLGEGFWRWRLNEFDRNDNAAAFDELFGKLIQFLSTTEDKNKFRSYPVKQEFPDTEPVIFESQVYNDIFEPVYGNSVEIELTDEGGKKTQYTYVTSPGNARYQIGGLRQGVYKYTSRTNINGTPETTRGQFAVVEQLAELQNLTADFDLLRELSANTGGEFIKATSLDALPSRLATAEATSIIRTEETYDSLINLKWIFWALLTLVAAEWFLRKFYGSY